MSASSPLSFLPDDYLETKRQRRTNQVCAGLLVVITVTISIAFYGIERSLGEVERQHSQVEQQFADAAKRIDQVRQMQDKQRKMAHQAELTSSLLEKIPRSFLLAEITNALPAGVCLLDLNLESKVRQQQAAQPPKTQFEMKKAAMEAANGIPQPVTAKTYDVGMKLTGLADTDVQVAQFIARLNRSKLLRDVNLLISDEFVFKDSNMRKFQIEMMVNPAAEIQPGANSSLSRLETR